MRMLRQLALGLFFTIIASITARAECTTDQIISLLNNGYSKEEIQAQCNTNGNPQGFSMGGDQNSATPTINSPNDLVQYLTGKWLYVCRGGGVPINELWQFGPNGQGGVRVDVLKGIMGSAPMAVGQAGFSNNHFTFSYMVVEGVTSNVDIALVSQDQMVGTVSTSNTILRDLGVDDMMQGFGGGSSVINDTCQATFSRQNQQNQ